MEALSFWQKLRHRWLLRTIHKENANRDGVGGALLRDGSLNEVMSIDGYRWTLYDGRVVTAKDIADVGHPKWLYRIYC